MSKQLLMKLALFGARLLSAYSILIWIRIIFSWFNRYPQRSSFVYYMAKMVDPFLNVFKGRKSTIGVLDFSPIFAIGVIYIFQSLFEIFGVYGRITLSIILQIFVYAFWSYGVSIFFWILVFALIFRTVASFSRNPGLWNASSAMGEAARPVTDFVKSFYKSSIPSEKTINLISLALTLVMWFVCHYLVQYLIGVLVHIPL
ncbi:MAG: YggT family protein [Spirochaetales bacterium]|nr:YggT family protein [Candidatus Physcosoma equi]